MQSSASLYKAEKTIEPTLQTFQLPQANLGALRYAQPGHPLEMMCHAAPSGDDGWYEARGKESLCV